MQLRSIDSSFVWLHRLIDTLVPPATLFLCSLNYGVDWNNYSHAALLSGLLLPIMNQFNGLYRSWRGRSIFEGSRITLQSWIMVWALLIIVAFLLKVSEQFSRVVLTEWFLLTPVVLIGYRIVIRLILSTLYKTGIFNKKVAIYGSGSASEQLRKTFNLHHWLGYELVSIYDDLSVENTTDDLKGGVHKLLEDANSGVFETLYIALPASRESEIKQLLSELSDTTVRVKYLPDFFSYDLIHSSMITIGGMPVINIYDSPLNDPGKATIKRLEDIIFSILILILFWPVMLLIALGVKLNSPGPVFFKQTRYGLKGEEFDVYKFRSMTTQDNGSVIKQATKNDQRTTRFGRFLRRTSLDELPQFVNVIQGRMSIVGPRPHAVAHNEEYRKLVPKYMQRHLVKPGITGWAQVNGWRGETDTLEKMQKRVEFDLFYISHWSFWTDIKIIVLTVFKGFINKNAY
jgi:putative colanic acid biosynthesis UDP-glucose lipid carrier transferase